MRPDNSFRPKPLRGSAQSAVGCRPSTSGQGGDMAGQHQGSCLCGGVRFIIGGEFESFYLCHCTHCQKGTGSAHGANLFSSKAGVEWLSGADKVKTFNLPGTRHGRCFCADCGSALPCINGNLLVVPAGSLDSDPAMSPDGHIFIASRAPWDNDLASAPGFDAFPP